MRLMICSAEIKERDSDQVTSAVLVYILNIALVQFPYCQEIRAFWRHDATTNDNWSQNDNITLTISCFPMPTIDVTKSQEQICFCEVAAASRIPTIPQLSYAI